MRWGGDLALIASVYRMVDIGRLGVIDQEMHPGDEDMCTKS